MPKSIILMSGGLDSTLLASKLIKEKTDLLCIYINTGHPSSQHELKSFRKTVGQFNLLSDVINIPSLHTTFNSSALGSRICLPNPGKNVLCLGSTIFYGIVIPYAHLNNIDRVYVGLTKLDSDYSKEYRPEFLSHISEISTIAGYKKIDFCAPFAHFEKEYVLKEYYDQILVDRSWSCVSDYDKHCGYCNGCKSRKDAFQKSGLLDNTKYDK